jgi:outer membrane receptor protein involved in Fe transport
VLTDTSGVVPIREQGNANLVPEVANTTTLGIVLQPAFLPNFSLAVDWYDIRIDNAIVGASATSTAIQRECIDSGGTSPFCELFVRPNPITDNSAGNFPTLLYSQNLNAAKQWTNGVDFEANYRLTLADVSSGLPGALGIRALVGYQPTLKRQTISSSPATESAGVAGQSKVNANIGFDYSTGGLGVAITERWQSSQYPSDPARNFDLREKIPAYSYTDISVHYEMDIGSASFTPFLTIENLFDKRPPIIGTIASVPGLFFPSAPGFDIVGRYFTAGIRANF